MKCSLVQELIDARRIMDQFKSLNDVLAERNGHPYRLINWFRDHPSVLNSLRITNLSYSEIEHRLNQKMADLF